MSDAAAELALRRWDAERDGPPTEAKLRALLEARGYMVTRYTYSPAGHPFPSSHSRRGED